MKVVEGDVQDQTVSARRGVSFARSWVVNPTQTND